MGSKDRKQLELLPSEQPHVEAVTADLVARVRRLPTFLRAWNYAQDIAQLEDKSVYERLEIDVSHWTKIRKGKASPPADERFVSYFDAVQNDIPLIWLAEARGYDFLSMRKHFASELEKRNAELEEEVAALRRVVACGARK